MFLFAFQEVRLVPDGSMFIHIALILIMIWILNRTLFRPVNRIIESREKNKGGHSSEAQEILKGISEKQSRYDAAMLAARSEGYELIERARSEAVAARQQKLGAVKEEVAQVIERQTQELDRQTSAARAAIAQDAENIAEKISSSILKTT